MPRMGQANQAWDTEQTEDRAEVTELTGIVMKTV